LFKGKISNDLRHFKRETRTPLIVERSAEIRDPVHGYIYANELEKAIIDCPVFQRLRKIRQLAGCHLVYPGGQHTRFEHSIGSMYLAGEVSSILERQPSLGFGEEDRQILRLSALLHDIGHGPFSHVFEEVAFEKGRFTHEDMTKEIILQTEIGDILDRYGFSRRTISELATASSKERGRKYLNHIIGGSLSVDLMDYLLRDSYFTGVEYGKVDARRIIYSLKAIKNDGVAIDQAALFAFEALVIARYEMFRAVYFHRTVRAAELMIVKSMILADKALQFTERSINRYLKLTDDVTMNELKNLEPGEDSELKRAKELATRYDRRDLLKCVFERSVQRKDAFLSSILKDKGVRQDIASRIAVEADIDPDEVIVDVPTAASVPASPDKDSLDLAVVPSRGRSGASVKYLSMSESALPLARNIAGYMDIVRVYTSNLKRKKAEDAAKKVFGGESFETLIST
jgi:HD superfamily phosphohydrolase